MIQLESFSTQFKNNFEKQHKPEPFFGDMSVHEFYKFHHARSIVVILLNIFPPNFYKVFTYQRNMILIQCIMNVTQ